MMKKIFYIVTGILLGAGFTASAAFTTVPLTKNGVLEMLGFPNDSLVIGRTSTTTNSKLEVNGTTTATNFVATSTTVDSVFPRLSVTNSTTTNATSTTLFATKASTTNFFGAGLSTCNAASQAVTYANGTFGCNSISPVGGSGVGTVATSSTETANQIPYYTSTNGYPALIGSEAGFEYDPTVDTMSVGTIKASNYYDPSGIFGIVIDNAQGITITPNAAKTVAIADPTSGLLAEFITSGLTSSRAYTLPDKDGTYAMLSDITNASSTLLTDNNTFSGDNIFGGSSVGLFLGGGGISQIGSSYPQSAGVILSDRIRFSFDVAPASGVDGYPIQFVGNSGSAGNSNGSSIEFYTGLPSGTGATGTMKFYTGSDLIFEGASSTVATSTFYSNLHVTGGLKVGDASILLQGNSTSTFSKGIELTGGCFKVAGACLSSGGSGASSTMLADNNTFTGDNVFSKLAVTRSTTTSATTTNLFVNLFTANGPLLVGTTSTTTIWGNGATSTFAGPVTAGGSGTSTFSNGIELSAGCFKVAGACISAGGSGASSTLLSDSNIFSGANIFTNILRSTTTSATTTNLNISGGLSFDGVTGTAWSSFCTSITGSADLCDGSDATGGAGSGITSASSTASWIVYPKGSNIVAYDTTLNTERFTGTSWNAVFTQIVGAATTTPRSLTAPGLSVYVKEGLYPVTGTSTIDGGSSDMGPQWVITGAGASTTFIMGANTSLFNPRRQASVLMSNFSVAFNSNFPSAIGIWASNTAPFSTQVQSSMRESRFSNIKFFSTTSPNVGTAMILDSDFRNTFDHMEIKYLGQGIIQRNYYTNGQFISGDDHWTRLFCEVDSGAPGVCYDAYGVNGQINQVTIDDVNGISNDTATFNDIFFRGRNVMSFHITNANVENFATTTQFLTGSVGNTFLSNKYIVPYGSATKYGGLFENDATSYNNTFSCSRVDTLAGSNVWVVYDKNSVANYGYSLPNIFQGVDGGGCKISGSATEIYFNATSSTIIRDVVDDVNGTNNLYDNVKVDGNRLILNFKQATAAAYSYLQNVSNGIGFFISGVQKMVLTSAGRLGIGTSTPWGLLSIQGIAGQTNPLFDVASSTGSNSYLSLFSVMANGTVITTSPSGTTTKNRILNEPDGIAATAVVANYTATYSDDLSRMLACGAIASTGVIGLRNGSFAASGVSNVYLQTGTAQQLTAATMANGVTTIIPRGCVTAEGYHYVFLASTTNAAATAVRRATSSDFVNIAAAASWATSTVSGLALETTGFLVGYERGTLYIATSTTRIAKYTVGTTSNTLTYAGTVTITGANITFANTRVNDNGIYAGFAAAPMIRKYTLAGVAVNGANYVLTAIANGPDFLAMKNSVYAMAGGSTVYMSRLFGY